MKHKKQRKQCACCEARRLCLEHSTHHDNGKPDGGKAFFCDKCVRTCGPGGCEVT